MTAARLIATKGLGFGPAPIAEWLYLHLLQELKLSVFLRHCLAYRMNFNTQSTARPNSKKPLKRNRKTTCAFNGCLPRYTASSSKRYPELAETELHRPGTARPSTFNSQWHSTTSCYDCCRIEIVHSISNYS